LPLKEARRALTRALDLLVMGAAIFVMGRAGAWWVRRNALKPSVRVDSLRIVGVGLRRDRADGIKSLLG
jgi:hypothetical protein